MAASTLSRVSGRTFGCSFRTRETVWCDTPASRATSAMTGGLDRLPALRTTDVRTRFLARSPGDDVTSCLHSAARAAAPCGQPKPTLALTFVQIKHRRYHVEAPDCDMRLFAAARIPCTSA